MARGMARGRRKILAVTRGALVFAALLTLMPALGQAAGDCDAFFPDFNCDERQARPEGSVVPMSFPYLFEDPYITSGLNLVGIWNEVPNDLKIAGLKTGGDIGVLALQIRLAITDRLAFIATKDGLGFVNTDHPLLDDEVGFFNLGFGFKYAAWEWQGNEGESFVLTPSLRYEAPTGQDKVFQGTDGDGIMIPAVSGAYHADNWNVMGIFGGNAAIDKDKNSSNIFYNLHISHAFPVETGWLDFIVPFIELNAIHWTDSGDGSRKVDTEVGSLPIGALRDNFEGNDAINLGNKKVSGNDYVSMAWGVRFPMAAGFDIGASYERPISNRKDVTEQRVTVMLTWEL